MGWVSPGEKEKNKTLPSLAGDAGGPGSSLPRGVPRGSRPPQTPAVEAFGDGPMRVTARLSLTPRRF